MLRSKLLCVAVMLTAGSLGLVACGGEDDKVALGTFAQDVCTAASDWATTIQDRAGSLGETLDPDASPEEGKEALSNFLGEIVADTEDLITEVEDAGVPDVENGEEVSDQFVNAFEDAKTVLENAQEDVQDLPTDDPQAFSEAASEFGNSIQEALGNVGTSLQEGEKPEALQEAFDEEEACQEVPGV